MEYFRSEKVTNSTTRIFGVYKEMMYLVEGKEKALLIDAGIGVGDLAAYVKTLTCKPVELVVTHGHLDHCGGAPLFNSVYLNQKDIELSRGNSNIETRASLIRSVVGKDIPYKSFVLQTKVDYKPLNDGDSFDLGGLTVEMLAMPGHTPGMICPLIVQERTVVFGDGCNPTVFLFLPESLSVSEYRKQLLEFKKRYADRYDMVYLSHMMGTCDKTLLDEVIEVCDDILKGNADNMPFEFLGNTYQVAKNIDKKTLRREDGKFGNIIYKA
jgi:glyoxylase-like metal-dependent hydrolase (beta-lactamase superfamily II)